MGSCGCIWDLIPQDTQIFLSGWFGVIVAIVMLFGMTVILLKVIGIAWKNLTGGYVQVSESNSKPSAVSTKSVKSQNAIMREEQHERIREAHRKSKKIVRSWHDERQSAIMQEFLPPIEDFEVSELAQVASSYMTEDDFDYNG